MVWPGREVCVVSIERPLKTYGTQCWFSIWIFLSIYVDFRFVDFFKAYSQRKTCEVLTAIDAEILFWKSPPGIEDECDLQPPIIDTIWTVNHPLLCFLQRWVLDSIRLHGELFSHRKSFLLFKGPGSFKFFFTNWRKCSVFKVYRLIRYHSHPSPLWLF